MKKVFLPLAFAVASVAAVPAAQAADGNGFVTVKAGQTSWSLNDQYSDNETAFSWGAQGGYRWSLNDTNAIGFDVGYVDFGSISDSGSGVSASLDGSAITVGGNYKLTFGGPTADDWYFEARAGYMKLTLDASLNFAGLGSASGSDDFSGIYLGAGIGYNITPTFGLSLNYDYHQADDVYDDSLNLAMFSVAAEFRF
ncbi:MAG TPA: outer membrane beta-barrel protein [Gammaproteobacteria bacterium]|nr:outer membrane beta-barrel protein [Gammaproteobacteria bacterium]